MPHFSRKPLALAVFYVFCSNVYAQDPGLQLKMQPELAPAPAKSEDEKTPIFIDAERIRGHQDTDVEAEGDAVLRDRGKSLFADWIRYSKELDELTAIGNVRFYEKGNFMQGPKLHLRFEDHTGFMESPTYRLEENNAHGSASRIIFEGENKYRAIDTSYTTCEIGRNDWFLRSSDLSIDRDRDIGVARNAHVVFKGVPILYTPWLDFPLSNKRKSGFLAPTFGTSVDSGIEFSLPYYWNIAPNYDATITPRVLSKRGVLLSNEFRYLEPRFSGETHIEVLPDDRVKRDTRSFFSWLHSHDFGGGLTAGVNFNRASDDSYFRDLGTTVAVTSQTHLPREGYITYSRDWWSFTSRVQRFQTLQDPLAPVTPPYDRTPQITFVGTKPNLFGSDFSMSSEYVNFRHSALINGRRFIAYPSLAYPLQNAYGYITPKVGVHYTSYQLDRTTTNLQDAQRTVPIFSIDSGVVFEREARLRNQDFIQTLEPRLYYLYVPYRNQDQLPLFDTGLGDFNFTQIFSENQFTGGDRINDANQVTFALTSRLLEENTGDERIRAAIGQRYYFRTPRVTMPGVPPDTHRTSDILFALSGQLTNAWAVDAGVQYDPHLTRSERFTYGTRYHPEIGKVINLGYRYTRDVLKQTDISFQWPLMGRWSAVGRWNYSLYDNKTLEALAGLEYNAGCWALRLVAHRFITATQDNANAIFVQLELNGISKLGSSPMELLSESIPGYGKLNQAPASGGSNP